MINEIEIGTLKSTQEIVLQILAGSLRIFKTKDGREVSANEIDFYASESVVEISAESEDTYTETIASDEDVTIGKEIITIMEEANEDLLGD